MLSSALNKKKLKRKTCPGSQSENVRAGGGRLKVYQHAITDEAAALLTSTDQEVLRRQRKKKHHRTALKKERKGEPEAASKHKKVNCDLRKEMKAAKNFIGDQCRTTDERITNKENSIQNIRNQTGADLQFDASPSPVPGMKILLVRGDSSEIQAAISLVSQKTGNKETMPRQAQEFWERWADIAFPDLENRHYFVPPIFVNRVPMVTCLTCSHEVRVLQPYIGLSGQSAVSPGHSAQPIQDSDARDDDAMQRVFVCLQALADHNGDTQVALTQLMFGNYLGQESYAAAAELFPRPRDQSVPYSMRRGDFDVLIIHKLYGLIVCEVKAFNITHINQQDVDGRIREKLRQVISQLNKAQAVLSHVVSDIAPGLRITKTMIFPNLASCEVQRSIAGDTHLKEDLGKCLDATLPDDVTGLCLFSDQMFDLRTPEEVKNERLGQLTDWWQRRVTKPGPDGHMTSELYKTLFARFCGPATTVQVACTSSPRMCIKTLSEAVWFTGDCYAQITLFPEQVELLNLAPPRVFLTGPPGTGKTVVLQLMATQWQVGGDDVHILSTWHRSRSACKMLHHLLQQTPGNSRPVGRVLYKQYDFINGKDTERAVMEMTKEAGDGPLYVIADEVGYDDKKELEHFKHFCDKLLRQVPDLHLWVASFYHGRVPPAWQEKSLTRPLRSPPAVVREVAKDRRIGSNCDVLPYSQRAVPDHTQGPSVRWIRHQGHGHTESADRDCELCGQKVVSFLKSLRLGAQASNSNDTAPPSLQYKDVLVLFWGAFNDKATVVMKIIDAGIPVKVMKTESDEIDVATASQNVVWVADGARVRGLERKVVVCLGQDRFHAMSRCTAQLVIVSH